MINSFLSYLVFFGLQNNIMIANGTGVIVFQREKMYRSFRYIDCLFLILGVIVSSMISFVLINYLYPIIELEFAHFLIMVLLIGLYNLLVAKIWKKMSKFKFYLYETSHSFAADLVYTLSVLFFLDTSVPILTFLFELLAVVIVILMMNVVIGFFVRSVNRGYMNISFRNVAARLFMMAIIAVLIYYGSMLVA